MRKILFILSLFLFFYLGCKNNQEKEIKIEYKDSSNNNVFKSQSDLENAILDTLSKLPEWIKANTYIDSLTQHKHGLAVTTEKPTHENTDYYFRVGYNGTEKFETYFHFYVNPQTFEIKIMDLVDGDIVPLDVWRKRELKRNKE